MKINHILLTISCFIIINSGIVFSQRPAGLSESENRKIDKLMKGSQLIPNVKQSVSSEAEIDFADSLYIYTPAIKGSVPDLDELQYFGYNFFTTSLDRLIWDNQPPHARYILGAGDGIIIEID